MSLEAQKSSSHCFCSASSSVSPSSRARFSVRGHRGAPARVVLVGPDWATPLNESRVLKLPR